MTASIHIDIAELGRLSDRVRKFLGNISDKSVLLDSMGLALVSNVQSRFETGESPDGTSWQPVKRDGQPLVDHGLLRDSITYKVAGDSVRVGTNRVGARTHQFGATIKPKKAKILHFTVGGKAVFAKQVVIPARPFLGVGEDDITAIRGTIADFILMSRREAV